MAKKFWIVNKINPTAAEILLYGYISPYDVSAADFIIELSQLCAIYSDIKIKINSGGGSVFEGIAMYNGIRQKIKEGKHIKTCVEGIAASMGAIIALAGEEISISKYGRMMIHRATGYASGDAEDMRLQADLIESAEGDCVKIIAERTGLKEKEVKEKFMQKGVDNWLKADKCIEYKLADKVYDAEPVPVPDNVTDEKAVYNIFETCLNKNTSQPKKYNMKKDLLKKLNLADDATDDQIDAAVERVLSEKDTADNAAKTALKAKAKTLVDGAIAAKKLTEADRVEYETMAESNYDFTAKAIEKIPAVKTITSQLIPKKEKKEGDAATEEVSEYEALVAQGTAVFAAFKAENPAEFRKMWEAHYKAPYPEPNA